MDKRLRIGVLIGAVLMALGITIGSMLALWGAGDRSTATVGSGPINTPAAGGTTGPTSSRGAPFIAVPSAASPFPAAAEPTPTPTPRRAPGHEVFGYVPYWEMDDGIAAHLAQTKLTTLLLFSVTHRSNGAIDTSQPGYRRISGPTGARLIREAKGRGVAVELVWTSFGLQKNARIFGSRRIQDATIAALVALARRLDFDGINVDVELLDEEFVPAYGEFVGRLRTALRKAMPEAPVSVATIAGPAGASMALAAAMAGVDRIFMMAYDYHWPGSEPGASAPLARRDGSEKDLRWSLDLYETAGVPVERTILGLPLYGIRWPVNGPELGAPRSGRGTPWIPSDNLGFLADPPFPPLRDPIEMVEFYRIWTGKGPPPPIPSPSPQILTPSPPIPTSTPVLSSASPTTPTGAPTASPSGPSEGGTPTPSAVAPSTTPIVISGWQAVYVDSAATLAPKLALANERGLAGAGFWAIGYERGQLAITELFDHFRAGALLSP